MLQLLSIIPTMFLYSCKDNFPTDPTVITGTVIGEDDLPVKGVKIRLAGSKRKGLSLLDTFDPVISTTDSAGRYTLSQVIPKETDIVDILIVDGSSDAPNASDGYVAYLEIDGSYRELSGSDYQIPYGKYGKTVTINYQLRKK